MVLNKPIVKRGKLMKVGSSIVIAVPSEWLNDKGLEAGKEIIIVANGNLTIMKDDKETNNRLTHHLTYATRPDEDTKGKTREALVSPTDKHPAIASGITSR